MGEKKHGKRLTSYDQGLSSAGECSKPILGSEVHSGLVMFSRVRAKGLMLGLI